MNQNTRTRVSIVLLAIGIYRQHRKLIPDIFTAAYIHLIFLFEESNIISRIWCPLDVSISFNELQCHYWFLYVILLCKRLPYWIRTNVVGFADLHLNHSDNGSYNTFCGSCRIRTCGTFYSSSVFKTDVLSQPYQTSNLYSCGSRRIRTFGTFRFGTLAVCWFKPLTHTSIQGIWYFNCCSLLQLISYFNDMIQQ